MLSNAGRTIAYHSETALRTAQNALPRRGISALVRRPKRRPLDEGVVEYDGEIVLATPLPSRSYGLKSARVVERLGRMGDARSVSLICIHAYEIPQEFSESALADAGVPYVLKGGERFFERPEVREAVLLLRGAAAGGSDPGALVPTVRDVLASTGWVEHRPPPGGAARDRWQSLAALVDLAVDLVVIGPEVVEGSAKPLRIYSDRAEEKGSTA